MPLEISRRDLRRLVAQGRAQLADVRPAAEYNKEHLPHAVSVPLETMTAAAARVLRKETPVIVYSNDERCDLSARAAWWLESLGFHEVYRYLGGLADWVAAGLQTQGDEAAKMRIRQMLSKHVPTCSPRERLEVVRSRRQPNEDLCVVVNEKNIVLGVVQGSIWDKNHHALVVDVMQPGPRTIRPDLKPKDAQKILQNYSAASAIVTTSDGELLGLVRIAQKKPQDGRNAA